MTIVDLVMPKMGESIMEATILKWHKKPGDQVKMDETLLEIATDKVDSDVPSTAAGILSEIFFKENDVVPVGAVIAKISSGNNGSISAEPVAAAADPAPAPQEETQPVYKTAAAGQPVSAPLSGTRFYSPLVLTIAGKEGVSLTELETMPGSGSEGRVTKKDILDYLANRGNEAPAAPAVAAPVPAVATETVQPAPTQPAVAAEPVVNNNVPQGNVEIIEMDRMRRLIADHMVRSKATSPHVTSFAEADVTHLVHWRERVKKDYEKIYGEKLTFTPLFIEAVVNCIRKYPLVNSSVDGNRILVKKDINIGMATALPSGNLIVPVIKSAETKNLLGLTRDVNNLANAARNNKLKVDDTQGGTFTLTNVGTFGSLMGTPIINQPQVAILAVGTIKKRPVVVETPDGDVIAIRHMMYLSLSYDHRIVDGSIGASFLTAVAKELEAFDVDRKI